MKTVYVYDNNGLFISPYDAQENPMQLGTYLKPVLSTETAPPSLQANQVAVFTNGAWIVKPDFRGQTWYDQTTGATVEITDIGQPPSNLGANPPPPTLAQAQDSQADVLDLAYSVASQQNVNYMNTVFQADSGSKNLLNQALTVYNAQSLPSGFYWVDFNNNQVTITYAQLQGLAQAMAVQVWTNFQNLQNKKKAVLQATTVQAVQAITF